MILRRPPRGPLRPFVQLLWLADDSDRAELAERPQRERVLPTGAMHLVIRLAGPPLRLFETASGGAAREVGSAVIGGVRGEYYIRDISEPTRSVGAQLYPGTSLALLGVPADVLAGRHTPLDQLWGRDGDVLRERMLDAGDAEAQLAIFEAALEARLPRVRGVHPAVAHALGRFAHGAEVAPVVDETGYSHRMFISLFRDAVGLTPKRYCRIRRFHRALAALREAPGCSLGELAYAAGYADQAHFTREFAEHAGVTPASFRRLAPEQPMHVPITGQKPSRPGGSKSPQ